MLVLLLDDKVIKYGINAWLQTESGSSFLKTLGFAAHRYRAQTVCAKADGGWRTYYILGNLFCVF